MYSSEFFESLIPPDLIDKLMRNYEKSTGEPYNPDSLVMVLNWMRAAIFDMIVTKMVLRDGTVIIDWDYDLNEPMFMATEEGIKGMEPHMGFPDVDIDIEGSFGGPLINEDDDPFTQ